ncbi:MAG TPA: hypothetical protein VGQ42_12515 [Candidatus Dormibacteraeota bacterium]|jgi:hypothetical protein|nr:hypothetical protein [Candidatus Dormibacteraeota bacterium]
MPAVPAIRARPRLPDPSTQQFTRDFNRSRTWLAKAAAAQPYLEHIEETVLGRGATLEAKAGGVVGGLAVLIAVIVGLGVVVWDLAAAWQRALLLLSGLYSVISLLAALLALRPRAMVLLAEDVVERHATKAKDAEELGASLAAYRAAAAIANRNRLIRLSNLIAVAGGCARNAVLVGLVPLFTIAVAQFRS